MVNISLYLRSAKTFSSEVPVYDFGVFETQGQEEYRSYNRTEQTTYFSGPDLRHNDRLIDLSLLSNPDLWVPTLAEPIREGIRVMRSCLAIEANKW